MCVLSNTQGNRQRSLGLSTGVSSQLEIIKLSILASCLQVRNLSALLYMATIFGLTQALFCHCARQAVIIELKKLSAMYPHQLDREEGHTSKAMLCLQDWATENVFEWSFHLIHILQEQGW